MVEKVLKALHWLLLVFAIIYLIKSPSNLYPPILLSSIFLMLLLAKIFLKPTKIPMLFLIVCAYVAILGEYFTLNFYQTIFYYDKILHMIVPLALTVLIYDRLRVSGLKKGTYYVSSLTVLGLKVIWELFEYFVDFVLKEKMQGVFDWLFHPLMYGLQDTMLDFTAGLVGVVIAIPIIMILERKTSFGKFLKQLL